MDEVIEKLKNSKLLSDKDVEILWQEWSSVWPNMSDQDKEKIVNNLTHIDKNQPGYRAHNSKAEENLRRIFDETGKNKNSGFTKGAISILLNDSDPELLDYIITNFEDLKSEKILNDNLVSEFYLKNYKDVNLELTKEVAKELKKISKKAITHKDFEHAKEGFVEASREVLSSDLIAMKLSLDLDSETFRKHLLSDNRVKDFFLGAAETDNFESIILEKDLFRYLDKFSEIDYNLIINREADILTRIHTYVECIEGNPYIFPKQATEAIQEDLENLDDNFLTNNYDKKRLGNFLEYLVNNKFKAISRDILSPYTAFNETHNEIIYTLISKLDFSPEFYNDLAEKITLGTENLINGENISPYAPILSYQELKNNIESNNNPPKLEDLRQIVNIYERAMGVEVYKITLLDNIPQKNDDDVKAGATWNHNKKELILSLSYIGNASMDKICSTIAHELSHASQGNLLESEDLKSRYKNNDLPDSEYYDIMVEKFVNMNYSKKKDLYPLMENEQQAYKVDDIPVNILVEYGKFLEFEKSGENPDNSNYSFNKDINGKIQIDVKPPYRY